MFVCRKKCDKTKRPKNRETKLRDREKTYCIRIRKIEI